MIDFDELFFKVFRNKYLFFRIFKEIEVINERYYSLKYDEIDDIQFIVLNDHWSLFKDKILLDNMEFEYQHNILEVIFSHFNDIEDDSHIQVIKYIVNQYKKKSETFILLIKDTGQVFNIVQIAANSNNIIALELLRDEITTKDTLNGAVRYGCLESAKWLHKNRTEGYDDSIILQEAVEARVNADGMVHFVLNDLKLQRKLFFTCGNSNTPHFRSTPKLSIDTIYLLFKMGILYYHNNSVEFYFYSQPIIKCNITTLMEYCKKLIFFNKVTEYLNNQKEEESEQNESGLESNGSNTSTEGGYTSLFTKLTNYFFGYRNVKTSTSTVKVSNGTTKQEFCDYINSCVEGKNEKELITIIFDYLKNDTLGLKETTKSYLYFSFLLRFGDISKQDIDGQLLVSSHNDTICHLFEVLWVCPTVENLNFVIQWVGEERFSRDVRSHDITVNLKPLDSIDIETQLKFIELLLSMKLNIRNCREIADYVIINFSIPQIEMVLKWFVKYNYLTDQINQNDLSDHLVYIALGYNIDIGKIRYLYNCKYSKFMKWPSKNIERIHCGTNYPTFLFLIESGFKFTSISMNAILHCNDLRIFKHILNKTDIIFDVRAYLFKKSHIRLMLKKPYDCKIGRFSTLKEFLKRCDKLKVNTDKLIEFINNNK
ncbi:hypothetical protein DLAC_06390 [Tieghemostelium lacteum]|uniref:Uncharacterized protein n=1 Tax=Tieghemostelium lacteum TaxID=361077 RepID=A0A151ZEN6_TIELA|nr:hypothetical protein DLAC_06390 [Tieghemostelium lacteum]|eukprot:KYQ92411.1 hypothetical protein DLAC_06390 [Tieghemostelium lacteum]